MTVGVQEAADLTGYTVRQVARISDEEREGEPRPRIRVLGQWAGHRKLSLADVLAIRAQRGPKAVRRP